MSDEVAREERNRQSATLWRVAGVCPVNFPRNPRCFCFVCKRKATKPVFMPPLMVRGGVERSETEGIRTIFKQKASAIAMKGRVIDKITRPSEYDPQKLDFFAENML